MSYAKVDTSGIRAMRKKHEAMTEAERRAFIKLVNKKLKEFKEKIK